MPDLLNLPSYTDPNAVVPPDPQTPQKPTESPEMTLREYIDAVGDRIGVPKQLRDAIYEGESGFQHYEAPGVVKRGRYKDGRPSGALGVSQLMPGTAKRHGVDINDPIQNAYGGLKEQKRLYDKYIEGGNEPNEAALLTAAAYNAGEGAVEKYRGIPPYAETQAYVAKIGKRLKQNPIKSGAALTAPVAQEATSQEAKTQPAPSSGKVETPAAGASWQERSEDSPSPEQQAKAAVDRAFGLGIWEQTPKEAREQLASNAAHMNTISDVVRLGDELGKEQDAARRAEIRRDRMRAKITATKANQQRNSVLEAGRAEMIVEASKVLPNTDPVLGSKILTEAITATPAQIIKYMRDRGMRGGFDSQSFTSAENQSRARLGLQPKEKQFESIRSGVNQGSFAPQVQARMQSEREQSLDTEAREYVIGHEFGGRSEYERRKELAPDDTANRLQGAIAVYKDDMKAREARAAELERNPNVTVWDKIVDLGGRPHQLIPFISSAGDIAEIVRVSQAGDKLMKGETLTREEQIELREFHNRLTQNPSLGYQIADTVSALPAFVGEFVLTGGVASAGKKLTLKGLEKLVTKEGMAKLESNLAGRIAKKSIANIGAGVLQTIPAGLTRIPAGALYRHEVQGDDFVPALAKSLTDQFIEVTSERAGGLLEHIPVPKRLSAIRDALTARWLGQGEGRTMAQLQKVIEKTGWNGVLGEMFEERVGDIAKYATGLQDNALPSPEQLLVEGISFSIPGIAERSAGAISQRVDRQRVVRSIQKEFNVDKDDANEILTLVRKHGLVDPEREVRPTSKAVPTERPEQPLPKQPTPAPAVEPARNSSVEAAQPVKAETTASMPSEGGVAKPSGLLDRPIARSETGEVRTSVRDVISDIPAEARKRLAAIPDNLGGIKTRQAVDAALEGVPNASAIKSDLYLVRDRAMGDDPWRNMFQAIRESNGEGKASSKSEGGVSERRMFERRALKGEAPDVNAARRADLERKQLSVREQRPASGLLDSRIGSDTALFSTVRELLKAIPRSALEALINQDVSQWKDLPTEAQYRRALDATLAKHPESTNKLAHLQAAFVERHDSTPYRTVVDAAREFLESPSKVASPRTTEIAQELARLAPSRPERRLAERRTDKRSVSEVSSQSTTDHEIKTATDLKSRLSILSPDELREYQQLRDEDARYATAVSEYEEGSPKDKAGLLKGKEDAERWFAARYFMNPEKTLPILTGTETEIRAQAVEHNRKQLKSPEFREAQILESVGGNAGDNRLAVNMAVDKDGRIAAIGNYQGLPAKTQQRLRTGDLYDVAALVTYPDFKIERFTGRVPERITSILNESLGGESAPTPQSAPKIVDALAHEAAHSPTNELAEPTDGQKEAGNYKKGKVRIAGLDISIENPQGSTRSGVDKAGHPWSIELKSHYGYIRGYEGKDKDHVDIFLKPGISPDYDGPVFVVNQRNEAGRFDEHKVMMGWPDRKSAQAGYRENYDKRHKGIGSITGFANTADFKHWLDNGDLKKVARTMIVPPRQGFQYMGGPLSEGLYREMFKRLKAGKPAASFKTGTEPAFEKLAESEYDAGRVKKWEDLWDLANPSTAKVPKGESMPTAQEIETAGQPIQLLGVDAILSEWHKDAENITYELYKAGNLGIVRAFDEDANRVVELIKYPSFVEAEKAYRKTVPDAGSDTLAKLKEAGAEVLNPDEVAKGAKPKIRVRAEAKEQPKEQPKELARITPKQIVRHSDPNIDGGEVVGKFPDGDLKVENKEGGISRVQNPRREGNREATIAKVGEPARRGIQVKATPVDNVTEAIKPPPSKRSTQTRQEYVGDRMRNLAPGSDPIIAQRSAIHEHEYAVKRAVKSGKFAEMVAAKELTPEKAVDILKSLGGTVPNYIKRELASLQGKAFEMVGKQIAGRVGVPKSDPTRNSLSEEVRARGGIHDDKDSTWSGELAALKESGKRGLTQPINSDSKKQQGMDAESMAGELAQDGYFPPGVERDETSGHDVTNVGEFLAAVTEDAAGSTKHYSDAYEPEIANHPDVEAFSKIEDDEYGQELLELIQSGHARAADIAELARVGREHGLSDEGLQAFLRAMDEQVKGEISKTSEGYSLDAKGTLLDPDGQPLFSRIQSTLGFGDSEGLFAEGGAKPVSEVKRKQIEELNRKHAEFQKEREQEVFGEETAKRLTSLAETKDRVGKIAQTILNDRRMASRDGSQGYIQSLVEAMETVRGAQSAQLPLKDYLRQDSLFGEAVSPEVAELAHGIEAGNFRFMEESRPLMMATAGKPLDFKHGDELTTAERYADEEPDIAWFRIQDSGKQTPARSTNWWAGGEGTHLNGVSAFISLHTASRDLLGREDVDGLGIGSYAGGIEEDGGDPVLSVFKGWDAGDESSNVNGFSVNAEMETEIRFSATEVLLAWKKAIVKEFPDDVAQVKDMDWDDLSEDYDLSGFDVDAFHALREIASLKSAIFNRRSAPNEYLDSLKAIDDDTDLIRDLKSSREEDIVWVNPEGQELLRRMESESSSGFFGIQIDRDSAIPILRDLKAGLQALRSASLSSSAIDALHRQIVDALTAGKGHALIVMEGESSESAIKHESFHQGSALGAKESPLSDRHTAENQERLHSMSAVAKWRRYFARTPGLTNASKALAIEETAAEIAGDGGQRIGLTEQEAAEFIYEWAKSFHEKNGPKAFEAFRRQEEHVNKAIEAAKRFSDQVKAQESLASGKAVRGRKGTARGQPEGGVSEVRPQAAGLGRRIELRGEGEVREASLPSTASRAGLEAEELYYQGFSHAQANQEGLALLERHGVEGSIRLLKDTPNPGAEHAVLSWKVQRSLLDDAATARAQGRDADAVALDRERRELAAAHASHGVHTGQFNSVAASIGVSAETALYAAERIVQEEYGAKATLLPKIAGRIEEHARASEQAFGEVTALTVELGELRKRVAQLEKERGARNPRNTVRIQLEAEEQGLINVVVKAFTLPPAALKMATEGGSLLRQLEDRRPDGMTWAELRQVSGEDDKYSRAIVAEWVKEGLAKIRPGLMYPDKLDRIEPTLKLLDLFASPETQEDYELINARNMIRARREGNPEIDETNSPLMMSAAVVLDTEAREALAKLGVLEFIRNPDVSVEDWNASLREKIGGDVEPYLVEAYIDAFALRRKMLKEARAAAVINEFHETHPDATEDELNDYLDTREAARQRAKLVSGEKATKTRLLIRINELKTLIETGEKSVKGQSSSNADIELLKSERDRLQGVVDEISAGPKTTPEDKRIEIATKAIKKSIADYDKRIAEGQVTPESKSNVAPWSEELGRLQTQRADLRKQLNEIRKQANAPKKARNAIASQLKAVSKSITALEARIQAGNFAPRAPGTPKPTSSEIEVAKAQRQTLQKLLADMRRAARPKKIKTQAEKDAARLLPVTRIIGELSPSNIVAETAGKILFNSKRAYSDLLDAGIPKGKAINIVKQAREIVSQAKKQAERERLAKAVEAAQGRKALDEEIDRVKTERLLAKKRGSEARAELARDLDAITKPWYGKVWGVGVDISNSSRSSLAAGDFSFLMRQGGFLMTAYPEQQGEALKRAYEAFTEIGELRAKDALEHRARFGQALRAGVDFASLGREEGGLVKGEEQFRGDLAKKIPGWGHVVKFSDRTYAVFLDTQRLITFEHLAADLESMGYNFRDNPKPFRDIARLINVATGRGHLLGFNSNQLAKMIMNMPYFSARNLISRFQLLNLTLNPVAYARLSPGARYIVARTAVRTYGTLALLAGLAALLGFKIILDWKDDDFGKVRVGDTRFDLSFGLVPVARHILRLTQIALRKQRYPGEKKSETVEEVLRFHRTKVAPGPSLFWDWYTGEDFRGQAFKWYSSPRADKPRLENIRRFMFEGAIVQRIWFLPVQDIQQAWHEDGFGAALLTTPTALGAGVSTYKDNPMEPHTAAERLAARLARPGTGAVDEPETEEKAETRERLRDLRARAMANENVSPDLDRMVQSGEITNLQAKNVQDAQGLSKLEYWVRKLPPEQALLVVKEGSAQEREELLPLMYGKVQRAAPGSLDAKTQAEIAKFSPDISKLFEQRKSVESELIKHEMRFPEADAKITIGNRETKLTGDKLLNYQKRVDALVYERLPKVIQSSEYQGAEPGTQKKMLQEAQSIAHALATAEIKTELAPSDRILAGQLKREQVRSQKLGTNTRVMRLRSERRQQVQERIHPQP